MWESEITIITHLVGKESFAPSEGGESERAQRTRRNVKNLRKIDFNKLTLQYYWEGTIYIQAIDKKIGIGQ